MDEEHVSAHARSSLGYHRRVRILMTFVLSAIAAMAAAAATVDGPYVVRDARGGLQSWTVDADQDGARRQVEPLAPNATITVPAVGKLPPFQVTLRPPAPAARDALTIPAKSPLFVVADTHGEYEILAQMLQAHGVVDRQLRWSFGPGQLVVLGDVFDRGPNHLEILWLLYELEAQARTAGGAVHLVLGNHETMVLLGDLRYLHPKYVASTRALRVGSYAALFDAGSVLGQWLRSRPAVLRVNRMLFLHAGISRALLERRLTLAEINATIRGALTGPPADTAARERTELLMTTLGPLWYRGYFPDHKDYPPATSADVATTLRHFEVDRILVGHTIVPAITPLYAGRVIAVQVYPKRDGAGQATFESLIIRGTKLFRALPDGTVQPLPMP
jgi:hypothetical protein